MSGGGKYSQSSTLLVDESFNQEDDQFVDRVRSVVTPQYLAALADRWKKDPRPWARKQIFDYLEQPMDRPGHQPLVKRLFKHAEAVRDHELMAAFLVAFDRLVRRQRRIHYRYDWNTRQSFQEEQLFAPRNQMPGKSNKPRNTSGRPIMPRNGRLFSYKTRAYLRRRAWRYFRRMGFQKPSEYISTIASALAQYRDEDFAKGENILDNWSLMNIAFRRSPDLRFSPARVQLADEGSLANLTAAPHFADLWKQHQSAPVLFSLLTQAQSRLVRVWAIQLLNRDHSQATQAISTDQLLSLLNHEDEEVQQFGAGVLDSIGAADNWPVSVWLQLLETRSMTALATICESMSRRVRPERLDLSQCVALACARPTPVARLGLSWLKTRSIQTEQDRATLARLAGAQCEAVGEEAAEYGLSILGAPQVYRPQEVSAFFDSLNPEIRRGAWNWLTPGSQGYGDAALWSRLLETPYDDVRIRLIEELNKRSKGEGTAAPPVKHQDLTPVWTSVLLGIHRGGRAKLKALRQISLAIADQPDRAEQLIPVLAVAIRSVRIAETRAGLSAILSAVAARPDLEALLTRSIPELRLTPMEVAS